MALKNPPPRVFCDPAREIKANELEDLSAGAGSNNQHAMLSVYWRS